MGGGGGCSFSAMSETVDGVGWRREGAYKQFLRPETSEYT